MLVVSREAGTSMYVGSADEDILITVLKLLPEARAISVLVSRTSVDHPGQLDCRTIELSINASIKVGRHVDVTLVDLRDEKARLGINAPRKSSVHRLEMYEAIRRGNWGDDPEQGMGGSRVPRPSSPLPPTLDVRLPEPPAGERSSE